ncbi:MAG: hypothetical protein PG981_001141 [Wolbachia endosymbiont of Ctenocephalides orientis wCori]|nr:MAG: hypothetical protein PG981_001141 [Wolbachia endosymbiont of Ctenocephalides orientis wCori]
MGCVVNMSNLLVRLLKLCEHLKAKMENLKTENSALRIENAEREIRHFVVYRKVSYFTQSQRGNIFLERIISLCLTWRQNS